jgi:uncharacterized protein YggE
MNRSWVRLLPRCAAIAAVLLLAGCVSGVPVSVTNHSASELRQVTVSGTGFSERIGTIAAGATETVRVRPRAETAVKVAFEVDGERYSAITEGEIENDDVNTVAVTVADDLSISMETQLR